MKTIIPLLFLTVFVVLASGFSLDRSLFSSPSEWKVESGADSRELASTNTPQSAAPRTNADDRVVAELPEEDVEPAPPAHVPAAQPAPSPASQVDPASASQQPPSNYSAQIEAEVLRLTNIERAKAGLGALSHNASLAAIAESHSADMLKRDFFSHDNPEGCSSSCRATNAGYKWQMIGENIYMMSGWDLTAEEAAIMIVNGWMSSPGHRENMLKAPYIESGVGVVSQGDTIYATALYANPR
ncbi:MAG TPA: CAP domain-containing protein [Candidatus Paceibacterota bacterium]|nr:CAP domain-containing protein [Candidatus Paceibacterota bacterium]